MPVWPRAILSCAGMVNKYLLMELDRDIVAPKRHVTLHRAQEQSRPQPVPWLDVLISLDWRPVSPVWQAPLLSDPGVRRVQELGSRSSLDHKLHFPFRPNSLAS